MHTDDETQPVMNVTFEQNIDRNYLKIVAL